MRTVYFRRRNDVQPKGMRQKRTCHGFQSNHPTAIKMSIALTRVGVLVYASVPVRQGGSSGEC